MGEAKKQRGQVREGDLVRARIATRHSNRTARVLRVPGLYWCERCQLPHSTGDFAVVRDLDRKKRR